MKQTIIYEGQNLLLPNGTGIAAYARTLGSIARELGYATEVLVGVDGPLRADDAQSNEIALRDAAYVQTPTRSHRRMMKMREIAGAPFGVRPVSFVRNGITVGDDNLAGFEVVHAASGLIDVARLHFTRWGRRLKVKPSLQPNLFQTTQATPIEVPGCPNIYTIHDIVPLRLPDTTLDIKPFFLDMVRHLCRHADHIVTVSEHSRADIMKLTGISGDRITNTYQAVALPAVDLARPQAEISAEVERFYGLGFQEYFLFVGALEPKKNVSRLIEAYASSGVNRPLVIVGKLGWQYEEILDKIQNERFYRLVPQGDGFAVSRRVVRLDYVPANRLVTLLRGARAFLFPSIYEGFGLPVLEAMQAGAPVMTSNSTSLAEVAGDGALLVDPYDVDDMAAAIRRLDGDADMRAELVRKGDLQARRFSREAYVRRVDELYRRVIG